VSGVIPIPGFASPLISTIERRVGSVLDATWIEDSPGHTRGYSFGPDSSRASGRNGRFATRFDSHDPDDEFNDDYRNGSRGGDYFDDRHHDDDYDDGDENPFSEKPKKKSASKFARGRSYTNPPPFSKRDSLESFKSEPRRFKPTRAEEDDYSPFEDSYQAGGGRRRAATTGGNGYGNGISGAPGYRPRDSFDDDLLKFSDANDADGTGGNNRFSFTATRDATVLPSDYFSTPSPNRKETFRFRGAKTPQTDMDLPSSSPFRSTDTRPSAPSRREKEADDAGMGKAIALFDFAGAEVSYELRNGTSPSSRVLTGLSICFFLNLL
jgi:hypothetical protein